ncbi:MAG: LacI family DNA-binding transcriptional regulator [Opitutaceae bacterium]|nr:LacI family DNA-binding transcriptional regulator [Opitutaceae bacterium]
MSVRRIASIAKVSHAAVSMALRDSPKISPAVKARIRKIARSMGYRPNAKIRELMTHVSQSKTGRFQACFGVISLYDTERPWEQSLHLSRMYGGMAKRAEELGYRLDPLWLKAPGMSFRRAREILEARGIDGLLCFGSPEFGARFPSELEGFAIVTQGLSIGVPMHRVISDGYSDTWNALDRVHRRGYRRPGLVLGFYEDQRNRHANASAYLGWCEQMMASAERVPILRIDQVDVDLLGTWLQRHSPDVVIFDHHYSMIEPFKAAIRQLGLSMPGKPGVAVVSQIVRGTGFAGMEENQQLMGAWAVELLAGRIVNRDFGLPTQARVEMVESRWVPGDSLPAVRTSRKRTRRAGAGQSA